MLTEANNYRMNTKRFKTVGKVSSKVLAVIISFAIVLTLSLEPSLDSKCSWLER